MGSWAGECGSGGAPSYPWRSQGSGVELEGPGRTSEGRRGEREGGGREKGEGGRGRYCSSQFLGAEREQTLLSRLLGPFPFDPPSLVTPPPRADSGVNFISELGRRPWNQARGSGCD